MIGLDTNVVLRHLLEDDAVQTPIAQRLFAKCCVPGADPCFISLGTMLEIVWVLRSRYRLPTSKISEVVQRLLTSDGIVVQNELEVYAALDDMDEGLATFEDALICALGKWIGCSYTLTLDRKALRLTGFELAQ